MQDYAVVEIYFLSCRSSSQRSSVHSSLQLYALLAICFWTILPSVEPQSKFHLTRSPAYNGTFAIAALMMACVLIYLGLNGYFVVRAWSKLVQRNKLLFVYTACFVVAILCLLWSSGFNYYSNSGPNLLLAVVICNLYPFMLVYIMLPIPKASEEVMRFFRNNEINQEINREYGRLPQVQEEELLSFHPEERLDRPPRRLQGVDDKPENWNRTPNESNDNTLEDDEDHRKNPHTTSLQNRPTLSPQEPFSGSNTKQKDGDSFTFN